MMNTSIVVARGVGNVVISGSVVDDEYCRSI